MFGGSGKLGRGGGGGRGSKRGIHSPLPPPPPLRPGGPNSSRIPIGASSSSSRRNQPSAGSAAPPTPEETFSLITSEPPAYAMIIRLAPDLVREIKSLEAQGHSARIKFGPNPNNPSGNVIDVGGKDFRFTWSLELGDLCNIYEERQSGEDGNGLLVESGSAWRKLNVQRILDESTRDHVKMLSEEAERLSKSRKAIVLDPGNPSVKNQAKTYVAAGVESNSRRSHFKQKEFFKKRKVEPSQAAVAAPPKSVYKSSTFLMGTVKNRLSVSPLPSPPEQAAASASPFGNGNPSRDQTGVDEFIAAQVKGRDDAANSEKDISGKSVCATMHELAHLKGNLGSTPMDLRNVLVTLLMENPKGMSLKALEKAVGETIPNSGKKIETIIKTIATFQAPGRYILRPGVEKDSFKKSSPESGSSPELPHVQTPADSGFPEKAPLEEFGQQAQLSSKAEEFSVLERNKTHEDSPDNFLTNGKMGNSSSSDSESESDSGSDSSDSGSDSGSQSRSKSRSPVRSGSASSSDSESDGTSSSREGSDVAVDIMASDDEKEVNLNLQAPVPLLLTASPISASNSKDVEKSDDMVNEIEFSKMSPVDNKIETYKENGMEMDVNIELGSYETNPRTSEDGVPISLDHSKQPERPHVAYVGSSVNENDEQTIKQSLDNERQIELDSSKYEESGNNVRNPKGKTKRVSEKMQEKSENNKRSKSGQPGSFAQPLGVGRSRDTILSERIQFEAHQDPNKRDHAMQISESVNRDGSSSRSMHAQDKSYMIKDRGYREIQDEEMMAANKVGTKNGRENSLGRSVDPQYRKSGEQSGKLSKDAGPILHGHMTSDPNIKQDAEKRPSVNGKEAVLRRELSDLELGEFREPIPGEETQEVKRQFERKNSFKLVDNRTNTAGNSSYDMTKGRNGEKAIQELKKQSLPGLRVGIQGIQDERLDSARPQHKAMPSQTQQFPRVGHAIPEALPQLDKSADGKAGKNEVRESEGIALEGHMSAYKKTPVSLLNHDTRITVPTGNSGTSKETRPQKSNPINDLADKIKDSSWMETVSGSGRRRESSSDEDDSFYSKYERDVPEFKGPIRDFSQYQEYLQEYEEKFNCYMSLYKIIENVRDEFLKIGQDLENAKGDIEYKKAMAHLMKAYRRFGERDKRMKKVFVVLHEEGKQIKERLMEYALSH